MYTVQNAITTARSAMDTVVFPNHKPREEVASRYYNHPYGGVARDIQVTRDGFMRFFEWGEWEMARAEHEQGKVVDRLHDLVECLGYIGYKKPNRVYTITIINRSHGALMKNAVRTTVPSSSN